MRCFLDLDGVLVDMINPLLRRLGKAWPEVWGEDAWDISLTLGMNPRDVWGSLDYGFWRSLPKTPEADGIIRICGDAFGRDSLCFLSSPIPTGRCAEAKIDWVQEHYPDIPLLLSCRSGTGTMPKHFVSHEDAVLIDDHTPNVMEFLRHGGDGFVFPRRWNLYHKFEREGVMQLEAWARLVQAGHRFEFSGG